MHAGNGRHFFGDHPAGLRNSGTYANFIRAFARAAKKLPPHIEILNATPGSALTCFPMVTLHDALRPLRLDVSTLDASPLPLDIALVREHLAVDGDDNDALIESFVLAAISWAEGAMHRTIYSRSHAWVLRDFPRDGYGEIRLPRGKTQSVESVQYSSGGSMVTLTGPSSGSPAGTGYQEDLRGDDGGVLMPARGSSWPSPDADAISPVVINFTAGYLAAEVPSDIVHGLLFACSDAFELRGSGDMTMFGRNFETRQLLISPYRLKRWH
jgi:uncharacterized phiE125 gp8 family phage protein